MDYLFPGIRKDYVAFILLALCIPQKLTVLRSYILSLSNWLFGLDFYLSQPQEIVVVGDSINATTVEIPPTLCTVWLPNKVVVGYDQSEESVLLGLELLEGKND